MKKIKLLAALFIVLFTACQKNKSEIITESKLNEFAILQVQSSRNLEEQKSMYKLLTPLEKSDIWNRKFNSFLLNQDLNLEQRLFIKDIQKIIKPDFFIQNINSKKIQFDDSEIKSNAIKFFGVSIANSLIANISEGGTQKIAGGDCGCSQESPWCGSSSRCDASRCNFEQGACGTLWLYNCDGVCQRTAVN